MRIVLLLACLLVGGCATTEAGLVVQKISVGSRFVAVVSFGLAANKGRRLNKSIGSAIEFFSRRPLPSNTPFSALNFLRTPASLVTPFVDHDRPILSFADVPSWIDLPIRAPLQ